MKKFLLAAATLIAPFVTAHANDEALLTEARKVATTLPPRLIVALQEEITKSGPEGAIPVCKDMAPKMAGEMHDQSNRVQANRLLRMSRLKSANPSFSANRSPLTYGKAASVSSRFFWRFSAGVLSTSNSRAK